MPSKTGGLPYLFVLHTGLGTRAAAVLRDSGLSTCPRAVIADRKIPKLPKRGGVVILK
jgi:hypothetical protein